MIFDFWTWKTKWQCGGQYCNQDKMTGYKNYGKHRVPTIFSGIFFHTFFNTVLKQSAQQRPEGLSSWPFWLGWDAGTHARVWGQEGMAGPVMSLSRVGGLTAGLGAEGFVPGAILHMAVFEHRKQRMEAFDDRVLGTGRCVKEVRSHFYAYIYKNELRAALLQLCPHINGIHAPSHRKGSCPPLAPPPLPGGGEE